MAAPERRVSQLRLRSRSEDDARRVMPALEDALRCASLPDEGGRLLLVRRLALGRLGRGMSPQALALRIERRVAEAPQQWVRGGTEEAAAAAQVVFEGAWQARVLLAQRLVQRADTSAWYWPLAVPEWRAAAGAADGLRRIVMTIAAWPEAARALPAWAGALEEAGGAAALAQLAADPDAGPLLRRAGVAVERAVLPPPRTGAGRERPAAGPAAEQAPVADRLPDAAGPEPAAVPQQGLRRAAHRGRAGAAAHTAAPPEGAGAAPVAVSQRGGAVQATAGGPAARRASTVPARRRVPPLPGEAEPQPGPESRRRRRPEDPAMDLPRPARAEGTSLAPLRKHRPAAPVEAPSATPWAGEPTPFGGLLFLLPVLERLGIAEWLAAAGAGPAGQPDGADPGFATRVLVAALGRLGAAPTDPIRLALGALRPAAALPAPAPARWADPLLRPGRASQGSRADELALALRQAADADAQARVWLAAVRRWLRRGAGIGLASLVVRPGRVLATPTHIDLRFGLDDADLRLRRLGLDLDPGWLPWFGRVVGFHFVREPQR